MFFRVQRLLFGCSVLCLTVGTNAEPEFCCKSHFCFCPELGKRHRLLKLTSQSKKRHQLFQSFWCFPPPQIFPPPQNLPPRQIFPPPPPPKSSSVCAAGCKQGVSEAPLPQQELVLVMPAVLPKLHTLAQAMLRCRGSHVFKVTPPELVTAVLSTWAFKIDAFCPAC